MRSCWLPYLPGLSISDNQYGSTPSTIIAWANSQLSRSSEHCWMVGWLLGVNAGHWLGGGPALPLAKIHNKTDGILKHIGLCSLTRVMEHTRTWLHYILCTNSFVLCPYRTINIPITSHQYQPLLTATDKGSPLWTITNQSWPSLTTTVSIINPFSNTTNHHQWSYNRSKSPSQRYLPPFHWANINHQLTMD